MPLDRSPPEAIREWETQIIEYAVSLATAFSLPRSVGQIFGLLFASAYPLCLDDVVGRLGISKGSASVGLNFLQRMTAIHPVEIPGDRRVHYIPETSLRRLAQGLIEESIMPHLQEGRIRVKGMDEAVERLPPEERAILKSRLKAVHTWQKKAGTFLPFLLKFLGKPLSGKPRSWDVPSRIPSD